MSTSTNSVREYVKYSSWLLKMAAMFNLLSNFFECHIVIFHRHNYPTQLCFVLFTPSPFWMKQCHIQLWEQGVFFLSIQEQILKSFTSAIILIICLTTETGIFILIYFSRIHFILEPAATTEPPSGPDSKTTESPLAAYYTDTTDMQCPSTDAQLHQRPAPQIQSTPPSTSSSKKPKKKNRCSHCNRKVKLSGM